MNEEECVEREPQAIGSATVDIDGAGRLWLEQADDCVMLGPAELRGLIVYAMQDPTFANVIRGAVKDGGP